MAEIKNKGLGPRVLNVKAGDGFTQYILNPGESVDTDDVALFDPANPVYAGWADSGDIEFPKGFLGEPEKKPGRRGGPAPAQPLAPLPNVGGPGAPPSQEAPAPAPGK